MEKLAQFVSQSFERPAIFRRHGHSRHRQSNNNNNNLIRQLSNSPELKISKAAIVLSVAQLVGANNNDNDTIESSDDIADTNKILQTDCGTFFF